MKATYIYGYYYILVGEKMKKAHFKFAALAS